jgi:4-aminobutyrate aminotransferase / (S)-3-amino-2-methylpropionate transaminase / 5-aminovalerate transaminase
VLSSGDVRTVCPSGSTALPSDWGQPANESLFRDDRRRSRGERYQDRSRRDAPIGGRRVRWRLSRQNAAGHDPHRISAPYKQRFGPFAPDIYHAPYPYEYRGWTTERALDRLQELFDSEVSPDRVAAILIEPELGDGGFVPAPTAYMRRLRQIADEHGIVLICDEIQTGFGRTGRMFGFEHSGIEPDLVTVAKGLANGFPMSAVIGRAGLMDAPELGGLGGTYGGNPLGCAAAMAVLDVFEEEALLERAGRLADILREGLVKIRNAHDCVGDVRGLGPMLAMEIVSDRQSKEPDGALTGTILAQSRERGLIVIRCGTHRNVVRLLAPLVTSDEEARRAMRILAEAVDASVAGRRGAKEESYA